MPACLRCPLPVSVGLRQQDVLIDFDIVLEQSVRMDDVRASRLGAAAHWHHDWVTVVQDRLPLQPTNLVACATD
jgi:hypothetical protein